MDILDKQAEALKRKAFLNIVAKRKEKQLMDLKRSGKIKKR